MSRIAPSYNDRSRYKISHNPTGTQITQEPVGWRDDDNEFVRDKQFHGIMAQMTNALVFHNDGSLFLQNIYKVFGVNSEVILIKEQRNSSTDIWEVAYSGYLDMTTYTKENRGVSVKFVSSGLLRTIKARQNDKIEIDRLDTFEGLEIPYLEPSIVELDGRFIYLQSVLETDSEQSISSYNINSDTGNWRWGVLGVNCALLISSDIHAQAIFPDSGHEIGGGASDQARVEQLFYADNDRQKTLSINITGTLDVLVHKLNRADNEFLQIVVAKYNNSTDYDIVERTVLETLSVPGIPPFSDPNVVQSIVLDYQEDIFLEKGESLSLQMYWGAELGSGGINAGNFGVTIQNVDVKINIDENSSFPPTTSKIHFPFEVFERHLKILTGQDGLFKSEVLGKTENGYSEDGEASLISLTHGFWVRGFSKDDVAEVEEENRYKPMTFSFKDLYESFFSVWNLGAGIEYEGFKEILRIEKLDFFYNKNELIHLGKVVDGKFQYTQVNNLKRTIDTNMFPSSLDIGYTKGGDYEEAIGLDEYNTRTTFTTVIDKIEKKYIATSKFRSDSYGMEFARRKPFETFATEDTQYDQSVWLNDVVRNDVDGQPYKQRLWERDFAVEPTGVFSPESAQNLRLSPFNILLRHGWKIGAGFTKYLDKFVRYTSSTANSGMVTQLIGGNAYSESGNIKNSELETARMDGEIIEFEFEVDYDLLQTVRGETLVLGEKIKNFYGLVVFKNEDGNIEKGYLQKLSPNGVGKWTLQKFNK